MQQQLLQLLALQVQDLRAARPHLREAEAAEQARAFFGAEADALTGEVGALADTMCARLPSSSGLQCAGSCLRLARVTVHTRACSGRLGEAFELKPNTQRARLCLPHELGRRVGSEGEVLAERRSSSDGAHASTHTKGQDVAFKVRRCCVNAAAGFCETVVLRLRAAALMRTACKHDGSLLRTGAYDSWSEGLLPFLPATWATRVPH